MSRFGERTKKIRRSKKSFSTLTIFWHLDPDSAALNLQQLGGATRSKSIFCETALHGAHAWVRGTYSQHVGAGGEPHPHLLCGSPHSFERKRFPQGCVQVAAVQKLHKTFIPRFPHRSTPAVAAGVLGARQRVFGNTQHMMLCVADH